MFDPRVTRTPSLLIWSQTRYHCAIGPHAVTSDSVLIRVAVERLLDNQKKCPMPIKIPPKQRRKFGIIKINCSYMKTGYDRSVILEMSQVVIFKSETIICCFYLKNKCTIFKNTLSRKKLFLVKPLWLQYLLLYKSHFFGVRRGFQHIFLA